MIYLKHWLLLIGAFWGSYRFYILLLLELRKKKAGQKKASWGKIVLFGGLFAVLLLLGGIFALLILSALIASGQATP